ncbi:hypothetical protein J4211_02180 [Candidatus Woesearchaeota archaeon]|nr:hypothetical protein [Candidatus Woesearchaeota archaeon]
MKWWLFLFLLPLVSGAAIDTAITTAALDEQSAQITSQYVIVSEGVEPLVVQLPSDVQHVTADMDGTTRECKLENNTALCGSTKADKHVFTISYTTRSALAALEERTLFRFNERLPFKTSEHTFILKLPVGTIIPKEEGKDADFFLTPKPSEVLSDGQRIIITWNTLDTTDIAVSAVVLSLQQNNVPVIIAVLVAAIVGGGATWYWLKHRKPTPKLIKRKANAKVKQPDTLSTVQPLVPQFVEHEQKVVQLLTKAPNQEIWQKQLLSETQFSKAKLSRIIRNLEERGVITKTIYGNTNKIGLKK